MKIEISAVTLENHHMSEFVKTRIETPIEPPIQGQRPSQANSVEEQNSTLEMKDNAKVMILKLLVQKLAGKDIEWFDQVEFTAANSAAKTPPTTPNDDAQQGPIQVIVEELHHEHQANSLKMAGKITTAAGRDISFEFKLNFEQSFTEYQRSIETINMKDPLIISFTSKPVELGESTHQFDIDADGNKDTLTQLGKGYGYLAFDRNNNGKIDDGQELFGALSGNGFADLSLYDEDGNGFIDENDVIFDSLKIWIKNSDEDKLVSLDDANIGAIATQSVNSPLNIRNDNGELKGAIRQSGYYINNDGNAGLIQQIDFVV
ncbi:hypothetical protein AAEU29_17335 [Pseudoalteromonas sp. SSM20]|uniref:hypothetical protein n=1 Tax=Pseudoalteromonas sp. SSM20 TaxID=3139394 RepID=UPI003BA9FCD4